jgi:hypothetical protein
MLCSQHGRIHVEPVDQLTPQNSFTNTLIIIYIFPKKNREYIFIEDFFLILILKKIKFFISENPSLLFKINKSIKYGHYCIW